jgi:hypothetical protein
MPQKYVHPPPFPPPPPPVGDDEEECVSNKEVYVMIKAMTKLFTKNQQSTDTTLERVECSMAGIIDRVDALEIGLPGTDQDKLPDDTRQDDPNHEEEEVDDDEPFNPPLPPPRWLHRDDQQAHQELPRHPRRPNWQGMGGHPQCGPNQ